jgi:hypothetical protein
MSSLTDFKGVYCSGIFIPEPSTVSALSLLFKKVYLPSNIKLIEEFSRKYRFGELWMTKPGLPLPKRIQIIDGDQHELFTHLTDTQRLTVCDYLFRGIQFFHYYKDLFPEVFESQFHKGDISITKEDNEYEKTHSVIVSNKGNLERDENEVPNMVSMGYIPVLDNNWGDMILQRNVDERSARQLASLLGMKSIEIIFPKTQGVRPEIIIEARERLADYLPPFWSAMFKLTVEMRNRIKVCKSAEDVFAESQYLIDTLVMPALIDLQQKMYKEKKNWFYKILSTVQRELRVVIGNPPLTLQQLLTNALAIGSDVLMTAVESMRTIEALKRESGLTFLLEAQKILSKGDAR